ncbi:MAG: ATP-dependent helicase [Candidatus Glassbacteria bacterium]
MTKYVIKPGERRGPFRVNYEKDLNDEQLRAVLAPGGPLLIIAGAGSGKTRTLTYRVARLVETGVPPERILLVTFTNKAAREMLHRVELLLGENVRSILGGTFHHVANVVLRKHAHLVGYKPNFSILDREDVRVLLQSSITEVIGDDRTVRFPKSNVLGDLFSLERNTEKPLEQVVLERAPFFHTLLDQIKEVRERFEARKMKMCAMDFDDLLQNWRNLMRDHDKVREEYSDRFLHVLVDEYQDINKIQGEIVDLLASVHRNLTVVGDDSQSIYSFRGADFENIIQFPERYPDATIFKLETNYRSTQNLLELANESILNNQRQFHKNLFSIRGPGRKPTIVPLEDELQQAEFVSQRVLELRDEGIPLDDMAVLYRSHYQSMELQMELTRRGIPFYPRSGLRFFEQRHIKDVTSYLRVLVNPSDELAWRRIWNLVPGIGAKTIERLWQELGADGRDFLSLADERFISLVPTRSKDSWRQFTNLMRKLREEFDGGKPSNLISIVMSAGYSDYLINNFMNYESRLEDINQLSNFSNMFDSTEKFLSELSLLSSVSGEDVAYGGYEDERLILSTVHQAKGLEWRVVFIIWAADSAFPSSRSLREEGGLEEERRLFYVAVTRTKDELYVCYPLITSGRGQEHLIQKPSRFIQELPEVVYEVWEVGYE